MKIKTKKQLNLPQLIEWAWDNNVKNEKYRCSDSNPYEYVWINENSNVELDEDMRISKNDTFTVEVEEEITEDTELDLIERFVGAMGYSCYTTHRMTIKDCLRRSPEECTTTHFYIENDERELVLIWRDGRLVD